LHSFGKDKGIMSLHIANQPHSINKYFIQSLEKTD
jgi:hypothetical protein